jgi:enoyl-CoA hydratase/carnithine racemase
MRLNRPRQLNALNLDMCAAMLEQLALWERDPACVAVWLEGEGEKGFCAGGDVAEVVRQIRAGGPHCFDYGDQFFSTEYRLNALMHRFAKPWVSVSHGVNMGGGLGLSVGASHRLVCERSRLAMPEIHIGLFPDVGGGWFLNRVPGGIGRIMAVTGLILNEADALFAGLADGFLAREMVDEARDRFLSMPWSAEPRSNHRIADAWMRSVCHPHRAGLPESPLRMYFDALRFIAQASDPQAMADSLARAAQDDPWFEAPAKSLASGSPTAAAVSLEYLRRARPLGIEQVLALDRVLAYHYARHHDFPEGVRALLIDKDRKPQWEFQGHEMVPWSHVESHFSDPHP